MDVPLALIGFGEAAAAFADAARWEGKARAFDIDPGRRQEMVARQVVASADARSALEDMPVVLSLVTADQALPAARSYAQFLRQDAYWYDMNSVAPDTKRQASETVEAQGAHYIDAAILAPVHPARMNIPILLSGPAAEGAHATLLASGFTDVRVIGEKIGQASAVKMIRSVMVKGVEALTDEMIAAAKAAGVVEDVLASLDACERSERWPVRAAYNLERMRTHGIRRAAEMEEAAATLSGLGVEPVMTAGTISRHRSAARPIQAGGDRI